MRDALIEGGLRALVSEMANMVDAVELGPGDRIINPDTRRPAVVDYVDEKGVVYLEDGRVIFNRGLPIRRLSVAPAGRPLAMDEYLKMMKALEGVRRSLERIIEERPSAEGLGMEELMSMLDGMIMTTRKKMGGGGIY